MPNTPVRAAAEGMPDPIITAVQAYRDGNAAFNAIKEAEYEAHGGEDAVIAKTYGAPMDALSDWDQPAKTRAGAIEALRLIQHENRMSSSVPFIDPLLTSALAYFEAERGPCSDAFRCVSDMETALTTIGDMLRGIAMIAETLDEGDGAVVQRMAWLTHEQYREVEKLRGDLWRLTHPDRDRLEREGWSS
jgi:hypothetical protein